MKKKNNKKKEIQISSPIRINNEAAKPSLATLKI